MMRSKPIATAQAPSVKAPEVYHHGDLRAALIAAAREALETTSPEAITLKSLAARLGVSQPAPYRHFSSREALLAAVAADGFDRFREQLMDVEQAAPDAEKFEAGCLGYLAFGRANRGVYRLMFASNLLKSSVDPALEHAAAAAFDLLLAGVAHFTPEDRAYATAVWVWSTLHGLVMLEAEGLLSGPRPGEMQPIDVVREMLAALRALQGR